MMATRLSRRATALIAGATALLAILLLFMAVFPAEWFKDYAEAALSRQIGRNISIGAMTREDAFSFAPIIRLTDVDVPQPPWAGNGKLASVRLLRVRVNVFSILTGKLEPKLLSATGATLYLVRDADRRENWRGGNESAAGSGISLTQLTSLDAIITYRDAFQSRGFRIAARVDRKSGLTASGRGEIDGNPVRLSATGASPNDGAWPFRLAVTGDAVDLQAQGTMAAPFDTAHMRFHATARANDLKLIDRVIEAGLFGTQPVRLSADVVRDGTNWTISDLAGTIGSSDVAGRATVIKSGRETKLDAVVRSRRLDFDDLASDAGNAAAMALERTEGLKIVPNTRINIRKVAVTDGRVAFHIDHVVSGRRPTALASMNGVLTIKDKLLMANPLKIGLTRGEISGSVTVDQRHGRSKPQVTIALDLRGGSIGALSGGGDKIDAPVDARVRLAGPGDTIREAVGNANGSIGIVAHDGALPARLAALMGFDLGRALLAGDDDRSSLRCAVVRLDMQHGLGTVSPLVVDTSRSQLTGRGKVRFPEEQLAILLIGSPKGNSVLRVPGSITANGTIRNPQISVPRKIKSFGNVLKGIGRAITGRQGPKAVDADCGALSQQALVR